jgi:hypothetical protein
VATLLTTPPPPPQSAATHRTTANAALKTNTPPHTHYAKVRMVDARPGIAFVEFDSDLSSSTALAGLQGFKITPENAMELSFAKQ